jgi:hypothetical protein
MVIGEMGIGSWRWRDGDREMVIERCGSGDSDREMVIETVTGGWDDI